MFLNLCRRGITNMSNSQRGIKAKSRLYIFTQFPPFPSLYFPLTLTHRVKNQQLCSNNSAGSDCYKINETECRTLYESEKTNSDKSCTQT